MLVENVVYFMVIKDGTKKKTLVTSLIKKENIIAQTMIHFDVVFNAPWVIGLWMYGNINIDFNPICFLFEEYFELFIIKVQIYPLKRMTQFLLKDTHPIWWFLFRLIMFLLSIFGVDEMLTMMILITFFFLL